MRALCYLFLSVLSQVRAEALKVSGHVGHNVTMPCAYSARVHGLLSFCWGRGKVPTFKCSNRIIYAKDGVVSFISESRYQLLGHLSDGDVSLTILNVRPGDTGVYGCRIEIPGMFNDYKANIYLAVEEVHVPSQQTVTQVSLPVTAKRQQAISEVSEFEHAGGDDLTLNCKGRDEEASRAFQEVGNICRIAAIVSLTVLIIPIFIASEKRPRPLTQLKTSTRENVYEMI